MGFGVGHPFSHFLICFARESATRTASPFTRLDFADGSYSCVPPEQYCARMLDSRMCNQEALDSPVDATPDVARCRPAQPAGDPRRFPRGSGSNWRLAACGTTRRVPGARRASGDFVSGFAQAFKDAVAHGHFGDLGTTMFTMVVLNSRIHPRRVYLFFLVMTLHDYGHTASLRNWFTWLGHAARNQSWRIPRDISKA